MDFLEILAEAEENNQKLYTPYVPKGEPETWNSAYRPLGLPRDPSYYDFPPGLEGAGASAVSSLSLSSVDEIWDKVTQNSLGAAGWVGQKAKDLVSGSYGLLKEGVGELAEDITNPLSSNIKTVYWYLIGAVVVIGGVVYFAGKSGAVRISKVV